MTIVYPEELLTKRVADLEQALRCAVEAERNKIAEWLRACAADADDAMGREDDSTFRRYMHQARRDELLEQAETIKAGAVGISLKGRF